MVQVYVPAGDFEMGATAFDDETPPHIVYLDAFWIDQTEVTNAKYAQCVATATHLHFNVITQKGKIILPNPTFGPAVQS